MADNDSYKATLVEALKARADWLERSQLPKLKDELRGFHAGFGSLYNLYLKKGLIHEDPYKAEAKIAELEVPSIISFTEMEKLDQLTKRLANFDNQLDFLVNFYQFSVEFLNMDRIKRILGLVKYIDWIHLSSDTSNPVSQAVADMTNQVKLGSDPITLSVISESLSHLAKSSTLILGHLKSLTEYQRESYKLTLREMAENMSASDAANVQQIRKKFVAAKTGMPFYPDLADEVIRENDPNEGEELRAAVLKRLQIVEEKRKTVKRQVSYKSFLIDGITGLGGTVQSFSEIIPKLDENSIILENEKSGFLTKLKKLIQQMLNREPDPLVYEVESIDPVKGIPVKEKVDFNYFVSDLERKVRTLTPLASKGTASAKLEAMQEEQLVGFLERSIREIQNLHKTLNALDDFFKAEVAKENRDKIKGIKPELGVIKNAIVRANSRRHEYSAQKEEEEQLRRLGVNPEV